jgi:DNA invertase Pin-like site-specific DNA recombinase
MPVSSPTRSTSGACCWIVLDSAPRSVGHESGTKGERHRKAFAALLAAAARREFDLVLFWSLDRFSREDMARTVGYLQRLQANGVDFHSFTEEYLASDNELVRNILLAVMSSLAKVEVLRISERTIA